MFAALFEPNPILVREMRARFRHWGAFGLFFGYAMLLAVAMAWRYASAAEGYYIVRNPLTRLSALGHELFLTSTWMQALVWALIAPAITAGTIAREREDGLLEGVLLAPLSPLTIIAGKLLSALSIIALLILISLPISAVCFLMGGVSPEEFRAALLLHASTAFFGSALGLACSAWSRRSNIALRSAYALVVVWLLGSGLSLGVASIPGLTSSRAWQQFLCSLFAWSNPILAGVALAEPGATNFAATPGGFLIDAPWIICVALLLSLGLLLLATSTFALRRPFEARDEAQLRLLQKTVAVPAAFAPSSSASTFEAAPAKAQRAEWVELPGTSQLHFSNPVLQREARGKFRMRPPTLWLLLFEIVLALGVGYLYILTFITAITHPNERDTIWWVLAFIGLSVLGLSAVVMGASAWTREREARTWEPLRLSLLSPGEILDAKLGAVLLAFLVYSLPFWPVLLPCVHPVLTIDPYSGQGVSLVQAMNCVALLSATAWCYTLWGMWWSWRCKRTVAAVGWSLGTLFLILVFVPAFGAIALSRSSDEWLWIYHPFVALGYVTDSGNSGEVFSAVGWGGVLFLTVCGLFLRHKLHAEMRDLPDISN
jgi:ABC-type transport system involved in multi-copper enzyme maturation permease subunit